MYFLLITFPCLVYNLKINFILILFMEHFVVGISSMSIKIHQKAPTISRIKIYFSICLIGYLGWLLMFWCYKNHFAHSYVRKSLTKYVIIFLGLVIRNELSDLGHRSVLKFSMLTAKLVSSAKECGFLNSIAWYTKIKKNNNVAKFRSLSSTTTKQQITLSYFAYFQLLSLFPLLLFFFLIVIIQIYALLSFEDV